MSKRILRNRTKTATIALVLVLTVAATFMASLQVAKAVTTLQLDLLLAVSPNPVGVGQGVTINVFTQPIPPSSNDRFSGLSVTIKRPGGTIDTLGPVTGGPLGNWIWIYVPGTVGTYEVQFHCPDQPFPSRDVLYKGGDSPVVLLVVQQAPIEVEPETPLPTEYWTYPINAQNRAWAATSGSWLRGSYNGTGFNPYTTGPKTSHILWKWRNAFGGIDGGDLGPVAYAQGRAYEGKMSPGIIINNYYYQYGPVGDRIISGASPLNCIDIATGQIVWTRNISVSWGQIYQYSSSNQVGLHAYLWGTVGTTWRMYDAFNGNYIMNFTNARSGGATVADPKDGNMLVYMINTRDGWMAMWNFTKCCDQGTTTGNGVITYQSQQERIQYGYRGGQWRPRTGALNDWMKGIQWNVTIPKETQWMDPTQSATLGKISAAGGVAVCAWPGDRFDPVLTPKSITQFYGYSLDNKNPRKLFGPINLTTAMTTAQSIGSDVYIRNMREEEKYYAYDLTTGRLVWKSDPLTYPWGSYASLSPTIAYDKLYSASYDGLHCWDIKTGKKLWFFSSGNSGIETPYGTWVGRGAVVGDGKVYFWTGAWHPTDIMEREDRLFCVDAYTGKNIWNVTFFGDTAILANGHLIANSCYDNYIYDFSKGPSKTTVSAPDNAVTDGTAVLIKGTVTDQSPGSKDTPAIADKDMDKWMDYLYMQQPKPLNAIGVPVELRAFRVDDGSMIDIATVYSDINGHYEYLWTPPKTGTYKILATFPGSDSYWQSSAETALGVVAAPPPAEPVEIPAYPDYTPIFMGLAAIGIVAIVIGLVNLFWKRK